jgi:hypothetical protein
LNSSNIKIHQTSAADLLLNVSNQQSGSFFCRLSLPIKLQAKNSSSRAVAQRNYFGWIPAILKFNKHQQLSLCVTSQIWKQRICLRLRLPIGFEPRTAAPELRHSAFMSPATHIKIHETSAADLLLNVSNQQSGTFFCRLLLPITF